MNTAYPFDPKFKNHLLLALGLAVWIFCFLNFTEPLDIDDFSTSEKWMYLPFYGLVGAGTYLLILPVQRLLYNKKNKWGILNEFSFFIVMAIIGFVLARMVYLYIVVPDEEYPYDLPYFITDIYIPALSAILPIVIIGRWALGKYKEKKLEDQKIEIKGEGIYEGIRLQQNDVICIKADDNYVEVSYLDNHEAKKQLIRNKLLVVEKEHPWLLRTHRSYLVNPYHFIQWQNSGGKLQMEVTTQLEIPVSKTYTDRVKQEVAI